jgi:hypothetical protein
VSRSSLALAALLAACSGDTIGPPVNPPPPPSQLPVQLTGLPEGYPHDRNNVPQPVAPLEGSGQLRGTVVGYSPPGAGADSLDTAPRIVGAAITVYPVTSPSAPFTLGPAVAGGTTNENGAFLVSVLPAGEYVVTIQTTDSRYSGQWLRGTIHPGTMQHGWWVVLAAR